MRALPIVAIGSALSLRAFLGGVVPGRATLVVGGGLVTLLALGWFLMSHFVMNTTTVDAINEALGVAFGLLVFASIIGAFVSRRDE
jgi:hypothetical protein